MSENEFNSLASKLLKDIGVQDTDTLNFFQTKPNSTEWKSSIKVPLPPKHRRASGTAHTRLTARAGQLQNGTQKKPSGDQNGSTNNAPRKLSTGDQNGTNSTAPRKLSGELYSTTAPRKLSGELYSTTAPRKLSGELYSTTCTAPRKLSIEQHSVNPQRRHTCSGEKMLRAPQYYSSSSAGQVTTSSKQSVGGGGPDGKFGYGGSATTANGTHTQPVQTAVTIPTKRIIARPAPKPPTQVIAVPANKSESVVRVTPAMRHSSSAGAVINGNPSSLSNKPSNVKVPTSVPTVEPKTKPFDSIDGTKVSKITSPVKPKEQLRRIASNPDRSKRTTVEVIELTPASFHIVSTSSHRILHTSEDGANSKRKPSLRTGFYNDTQSATKSQPMKALHPPLTRPSKSLPISKISSTQLKKKTQPPSDANNSGVYDSLSPPTSPLKQSPTNGGGITSTQGMKLSEAQSLSGTYDRLSPVELAAIRQISQEVSQKKPTNQIYRRAGTNSTNPDISQPRLENRNLKQPSTTVQNHKPSNLPVTSDKFSSKKQTRRHSSADHYVIKITNASTSVTQPPAAKAGESRLERSVQSPSSSSTATLSSPEPLSDRQTPDSDEKRSRLDNMSWSKQSLDRNMSAVATSTVEALSTLIEVLTPDPASKLNDNHFEYDGTPLPLNPNWYAETDDSDSSSYPLSPLSPELIPTSSSEPTSSPRIKSPLTTSISDNSISTTTKSESRVVQKVRFADNPVEIVEEKKTVKQNGVKTSNTSTEKEDLPSKIPPYTTFKNNNKSKAQQQMVTSSSKKKELSSNHKLTLPEKRSPEDPAKSQEITNGVAVNGLSNGLDSSIHDYALIDPQLHDYALIDPQLHDYAILDPEYHAEFFGYCQRCTKPVIGMNNGCVALDCVYHLKCFTCSKCSTPLSGFNFYTADDQVLCEVDYWSLLDTCHLCSLRIRDRVLRALDQSYHPDCFRCSVCSECLDGVPYISDAAGVVYCITDYHKKYAPICTVCDEPIVPEQGKSKSLRVRALDKSYHIECYKCESCGKQLASRSGSGERSYTAGDHLFCILCNMLLSSQGVITQSEHHSLTGTVL